ncbi:MAG: hypothetical protein QOC71_1175, partial [Thermoplasmata archaeon]|nr:hypothetical protein [Thermoplasmata archaeon]
MAVEGWDWAFVAASLVEIALGAWVFFASPGSPVNRGFALFLFATGLGDLTGAAAPDDPASRAGVSDAAYLAYFVSIAGLVLMALAYPDRKRLEGSERRILRGAWSLVALGIAFVVVGRSGSQGPIESVGLVLAAIILGSQGILAAWVSRHLGQGSSDQQRSTRLIILGLCIWPLWSAGSFLTGLGEGRSGLGWTTTVIMLLSTSAASVAVVRLLRAGDDG